MFIVLGATGHVGSAVAAALLDAGEPVTVVARDEAKAQRWRARGAEATSVDVADADALRDLFRRGDRAFLLNPPADPATDADAAERRTAAAIVAALDGSGLEMVVAQSTYGARAGERIGDLTVLHGFERTLAQQSVPATIVRGAYYMSNWDPLLEPARAGVLPSMFPADFPLPMVAPADLGAAAARLLRAPVGETGIHCVEGPARYTPADAAAAFAAALGRPVAVQVTPRDQIEPAYRALGFSPATAASFARMMAATIDGTFPPLDDVEQGPTTLDAYIGALVR